MNPSRAGFITNGLPLRGVAAIACCSCHSAEDRRRCQVLLPPPAARDAVLRSHHRRLPASPRSWSRSLLLATPRSCAATCSRPR
ncbi:Os04g0586400 [Oryza sativa Japonica Group]|uniref:Os04g0586400 protein n=1 Tax=Oryza sativa subsp. japonica TaxID=39947 RepID=A0A0P0WED5_ORYSJ|nr:hypothetical protein EE612_025221 [Oryza sativa]KAF2935559.1 hypothetical protein DAI22_04g240200 [Oryza sativa Japonica Group]BAS90707.1 Os04g0586400 [Oryza sativa Japonica Group]